MEITQTQLRLITTSAVCGMCVGKTYVGLFEDYRGFKGQYFGQWKNMFFRLF